MEEYAVTTISTKGQLTIPVQIRDQLRLKAGDKVRFLVDDDGTVVLFPIRGKIGDLYGSLPKPSRPVSLEQMDRVAEDEAATRYLK